MKKTTTSFLYVLSFLLHFLSFSLNATDFKGIPFIRTYLPKEYNAGMQNRQILQDRRGIIYMANNYGLLEYDGTTWNTYPVSNGTKVRSLAIQSNGRVYVGAQNQFGYFFPNDRGLMSYTSISDLLKKEDQQVGEVWNCYVRGEDIYFCTDNSVYKYDGKKISTLIEQSEINNSFMVNNQLYIHHTGKGLGLIEQDQHIPIFGSSIFKKNGISSLLPLSNDRLLVFTEEEGLFFYNGSEFQKWRVPANKILKEVFIQTAILLSDNSIAIGTRNNGIYLISGKGQLLSKLDKARGFNNKAVFGLMEDEFGNLWVGQNNGLAKIEYSSPFTYINEQFDLEGAGYCAFSNEDGLYLGTNNGLYVISGDFNKPGHDYQVNKPLGGQIYSMKEIRNRVLLGHENGAIFMDKGNIDYVIPTEGAWKFMSPKKRPDLLIEGNYYGLKSLVRKDDRWISKGELHGLHESSRVFLEDIDGSIWMTHGYKGVFKIYPSEDYTQIDSVLFYDDKDGFATNRLINVFKINNEFIFCSGQGIYRFDPPTDSFVLHKEFTDIFGDNAHIREMKEDGLGNIYFISAGYSGILTKDKFDGYQLYTKIFNKIHSKLNDDLEDISVLDFNNVLYGAHEGFIHYSPQKKSPLLNPINVLIRKVVSSNDGQVIFQGSFQHEGNVVNAQRKENLSSLNYYSNSILFQFSSTFADDDQKTSYSYFLKGYDESWSEWNYNNDKEYTNLREGQYEFMVKSKNIYEVESEISSYHFEVLAPWYRTTLAYFIGFLLFVGIIASIVVSQNVVHKKEKKVMSLTQKRELIRKDNEMVELSEKSKAEIIKLRNENLKFEINTKNKELASSTMNLIDKNQLLSGLKSDIKVMLDEGKKTTNTKALKEMIKKIDRSINHDEEWNHFQQYFDQVHGDFTSRLRLEFSNLSPQEVKLSNYLRMSLSTKEIAQLMNITTRGVEIARYRLRKKLNLSREVNLSEFIGRF